MAWTSISAIFFIIWWLTLFMVLPFGVRKVDIPELGHEHGAPAKPMLVRKAIITTILAAVATAIVVALANAGLFDYRGQV
jgi:predicted secreted protein